MEVRQPGLRHGPLNGQMTKSTTSEGVTAIDALSTLFALGREVTSVLNLEDLLQKIPELIARLTKFQAFAVYLLDTRGEELTIAYSVGYPDTVARTLRVKVGQGLVGAAVAEGLPLLSTMSMPIRATSKPWPARTPSWSCRCGARAASSAR